jgi:hypothetical protein
MREGRNIDWQTILNHMQGVMRTFFLEKRAETLTADQCKRIVELVKDYLGPATKTIDDLNEVLRLIDDAGFDPYAAISGEPVTRPPISSVNRRKFSIIGESPRISGISLPAASVHEDASVAEHAPVPGTVCPCASGVTFAGGSCATTPNP